MNFSKRVGPCTYSWVVVVSMFFFLACGSSPNIEVCYGNEQYFGQPGMAQQWANVQGNVTDTADSVVSLTYTLNGKPGPVFDGVAGKLNIGPHPSSKLPRRLLNAGDFNIDLN